MGVIVNLTVEDKDDPSTGAWRAAYTIINGNPAQSFEIRSNPLTNEGMLAVVKVRLAFRGRAHRLSPPRLPTEGSHVQNDLLGVGEWQLNSKEGWESALHMAHLGLVPNIP